VTLAAIVQVDATPTDILVTIDGLWNGATSNVSFTRVTCRECVGDYSEPPGAATSYVEDTSGATTVNETSFTASSTLHTRAVYIPTSGYEVVVTANICSSNAITDRIYARLTRNTTLVKAASSDGTTNERTCLAMQFFDRNPTPGLYTYTLDAYRVVAAITVISSDLRVEARLSR
jgi:hypothetical protein